MKGVSSTGGKNRLRFEKFSYRLKKLNVDVVHRVRHESSRSLAMETPDSGAMGCFFQDELEQCKVLETSASFKRFNYEVSPLVQSLPELIHHKKKVVELLMKQIISVVGLLLPCYLKVFIVRA
jgi:U3 small nucleolar RNA-associated protein 20